jgi:hypothetical protein
MMQLLLMLVCVQRKDILHMSPVQSSADDIYLIEH